MKRASIGIALLVSGFLAGLVLTGRLRSADESIAQSTQRTGQTIAVPRDCSVAAALHASGIELPVSCEQGVCGTCLTRVIAGEPEHRDSYLTDDERCRNDQFLPCCSRSRSACLVLDL